MPLYHVSENPTIARFDPRPPPTPHPAITFPVVWAVDDARLHNYLLPRDCPRVTFYAGPNSNPRDIASLIGPTSSRAVVAIESTWEPRVRSATLHLYEFPADTFQLIDPCAGYWISRVSITPHSRHEISDCIAALRTRTIDFRILDSLWPLHDAVIHSTLKYSCIRMRNASPRPAIHE